MSKDHAATLPERMVDLIGYSSALLKQAAAERAAAAEQRQKIAALIPRVIEALVSGERIQEAQREKAAQHLSDPVRALELLCKVAVHRNAGERRIGEPAAEKKASAYDSLNDPYVGRRSEQVKQSDYRLFAGLGLNPPSA